jgi:hypothetical protein
MYFREIGLVGMDRIELAQGMGQVERTYEHDNELSDSIKR